MSQEYCILNLLNIEDKNIKLLKNFYKIEKFDNINYKVMRKFLLMNQNFVVYVVVFMMIQKHMKKMVL